MRPTVFRDVASYCDGQQKEKKTRAGKILRLASLFPNENPSSSLAKCV